MAFSAPVPVNPTPISPANRVQHLCRRRARPPRRNGAARLRSSAAIDETNGRDFGQMNGDEAENWLARSRVNRKMAEVVRTKVVTCGGGSFGTAMANLLGRNGYPVTMLVRDEFVADGININHRNPRYLAHHSLPTNVTATTDTKTAFQDAQLCVHAVPVQQSRAFWSAHGTCIPDNIPILCTSKGLEVSSLLLMCELLPEMLGTERSYAYLAGPSFAAEMMQCLPTAVVVASKERELAHKLGDMLAAPWFRVFTSTDTVGVEIAGAMKNVIAIAAGMSDGLGLGTNSMAALVTRGCSEMRRIATLKGASPVTLSGLSGVGDTFLTCFGPLSRNRTVGVRLGRGEKLSDILSTSKQIAEGVATAKALVQWLGNDEECNPAETRASLKYPILFGVAAILDGKLTPKEGLDMLLATPPRIED